MGKKSSGLRVRELWVLVLVPPLCEHGQVSFISPVKWEEHIPTVVK